MLGSTYSLSPNTQAHIKYTPRVLFFRYYCGWVRHVELAIPARPGCDLAITDCVGANTSADM